MQKTKQATIFSLLAFFISCAGTASKSTAPKTFLDPARIDPVQILPGPPSPGSANFKNDFSILENYQVTRTKQQCDLAKSEVNFKHLLEFFQMPRGPLTEAEVKKWQPFFDEIIKEAHPIIGKAKEHWSRPRPYFTDTKLHPCVNQEPSFAYPSGHATGGELFARVLSEIFPDRKDAIMQRGFQIGEDRLIGGVHHPSDVHDGRLLADRIFEDMQTNSNFIAEIKKQ